VVVTAPYDAKKLVIKRIVGMPGDQIEAPALNPWESHRTEIVPAGHVWLQGDNLAQSTDSRYYGAVSMNLIKGRVFAKVPFMLFLFDYARAISDSCCLQIFPVWQSLPRTMEFAQQCSTAPQKSTL
jgi:signal peptidase I